MFLFIQLTLFSFIIYRVLPYIQRRNETTQQNNATKRRNNEMMQRPAALPPHATSQA